MTGFPDESRMARSEDGSEPIRGGSIGFNRVLGLFVQIANQDNRPRFNGVLISAFTIFRNIWDMSKDAKQEDLEKNFMNDISLFLEYFDTYLELVWNRNEDKFCPVVIYFPDYSFVPKEILRDHSTTKDGERMAAYKKFSNRVGNQEGLVKTMQHSRCFMIRAGHATYPHRDVVRKFKDIAAHTQSLYTSGDPVLLLTNITLDYYISARLRNVMLLESYTGKLRKPEEFRFRLDKEGRVPFQPSAHYALGDKDMIKPHITPKIKKLLLETAGRERWVGLSDGDVRNRIIKLTGLPPGDFRKYDFL